MSDRKKLAEVSLGMRNLASDLCKGGRDPALAQALATIYIGDRIAQLIALLEKEEA